MFDLAFGCSENELRQNSERVQVEDVVLVCFFFVLFLSNKEKGQSLCAHKAHDQKVYFLRLNFKFFISQNFLDSL